MKKRQFIRASGAALGSLAMPYIAKASTESRQDRSETASRRGPLILETRGRRLNVRAFGFATSDGWLRRVSRVGQNVLDAPTNRFGLGAVYGGRPNILQNWRRPKITLVIKIFVTNPDVPIFQTFNFADGSPFSDNVTIQHQDREFTPRIQLRPPSRETRFDPNGGETIGLGLVNDDGDILGLIPPSILDEDVLSGVEDTEARYAVYQDALRDHFGNLIARRLRQNLR